MTSTRPPSTSSAASSLMQDVPGAFPARTSNEEEHEQFTTYHTLSQAIHARRAEYVRPKHVRIKIGTWNVASHKGTEKDIGGWFVSGKGVTETLAGLNLDEPKKVSVEDVLGQSDAPLEDAGSQEARYARKQPTVPRNDPGLLPGNDDIGLYVLGLQEVVDIGSTTEALRPYTDPSVANKWKESMERSLPAGYTLVAEQQLLGLLLLIYAAPDVAPEVRSVSTTSVGTGLMGYMGNKGAVTARIVLGDTTRLVFVNSHLAAGADKTALERRNWDAAQIIQRTRFEPIQDAMDLQQSHGETLGDEDFAFWVGDLNYRLEGIPGDDVRRLLMLHTRNAYDLSQHSARKIDHEVEQATSSVKQRVEDRRSLNSSDSSSVPSERVSSDRSRTSTESTRPSTLVDEVGASDDPTSLQTTLSSLLPHDELHQQMKMRKAFGDGWQEGPITFLPTYKYDVGSVGVFDSSEKKRAPSWCDRILYRTRRGKLAHDAKVREEEHAKKKDEQMKASGTDQAAEDDEILYDYDPETDGANANDDYDEYDEHENAEDHIIITKEGFQDALDLEYYTAHQRVLSSDHKPLDAVFLLKYDAVVPEMKAKVHAEVAKDLDKAENEGRPNVTVVVDQHSEQAEQCEEHNREFEGVWFGDVRWGQAKHRSLTIANTSRVPASFSFIERPVGAGQTPGIAPSWLNLKINDAVLASSVKTSVPATIEPGETLAVELEIRIFERHLVHDLNEGMKSLDDILVLRVEGGRDHFIPVKAFWLASTLGRSIDKLVRIPEGGMRRLQKQRPGTASRSRASSRETSGAQSPEPVRFSAPRELFRLTEAIEDLAARVIAEWDMTSSDEHANAPWILHPGWPFDEQCWTERSTAQFEEAMSEACNALDTDEALEASLPGDVPRMQRLYVLSSLLLLFLDSMPDGVVDEALWSPIDAYLADSEKSKRNLTVEEQRMAIQEILAQSSSHSISFIIITSMLDRITQEISTVSRTREETPSNPVSPAAKKAAGALSRVTGALGKLSVASHREQACGVLARIFAGVMVRTPSAGEKKLSSAQGRRKVEFLELFLRKVEPG